MRNPFKSARRTIQPRPSNEPAKGFDGNGPSNLLLNQSSKQTFDKSNLKAQKSKTSMDSPKKAPSDQPLQQQFSSKKDIKTGAQSIISSNPGLSLDYQKALTGINLYDSQIKETELKTKQVRVNRAIRSGAILLLSQYKPKEFGNNKIDLTVDGGQHLRSPGEPPITITKKNVEQIFQDPVFDHKTQVYKAEKANREQLVGSVVSSISSL